jgi:thiol-disulfide isomerase/thioredoxin
VKIELRPRTVVLLALLGASLVALWNRTAVQVALYGVGKGVERRVGHMAPEIPPGVRTLDGRPAMLAAYRGQVVLLHFWTFGCSNCQKMVPSYVAWDRRYRRGGLAVLGVHTPELDYERSVPRLRQFVREHDIGFPTLVDLDDEVWDLYQVDAWPTAVLIDRAGVIRRTFVGDDQADAIERAFAALL